MAVLLNKHKTTMKRFLFDMVAVVLLTMMAGTMSSCMGCKGETAQKEAAQVYHDYDDVAFVDAVTGEVRDWDPAFK